MRMPLVVGGALCIGATFSTPTLANTFEGLGDLPGGMVSSHATAVSDDGETVVGWSESANGLEAIRWRSATGLFGLGDFPGGAFRSRAFDVSADGEVICGDGLDATTSDGLAFRWTESTGMVPVGDLPGGDVASFALGISSDGTVIVGGSSDDACGYRPYIWTEASGQVHIESICANPTSAECVTRDGNVLAGGALQSFGAWVWTSDNGVSAFGDLGGGLAHSALQGIADDGLTACGYGADVTGYRAIRWTAPATITVLPSLPGDVSTAVATGMTGDGSLISGYAGNYLAGMEALIWDGDLNVHCLESLLRARCIDEASEWELLTAEDLVGREGTLGVVGDALKPQGEPEAYRATLELPLCIEGDLNCDGSIGLSDLIQLLSSWGSDDCPADINRDGNVGTQDLLVVLSRWTS